MNPPQTGVHGFVVGMVPHIVFAVAGSHPDGSVPGDGHEAHGAIHGLSSSDQTWTTVGAIHPEPGMTRTSLIQVHSSRHALFGSVVVVAQLQLDGSNEVVVVVVVDEVGPDVVVVEVVLQTGGLPRFVEQLV